MITARGNLFSAFVALATATIGTTGCLPSDTRPPPAVVQFVAAPGDDPAGVETSDGWTLSVTHLIVGIGGASFNRACDLYSDTPYMRLLDGTRPGDQKISTMYALGRCEFAFQIGWPTEDTVLGAGITQADLERLGATAMLPDDRQIRAGIGVEMAITATKGPSTKRLAWAFRQATTYNRCHLLEGTKSVGLNLESDATVVLRVSLAATRIFASDNGKDAPLLFEPFAIADGMSGTPDGDVTLDEVDGVSLTDAKRFGAYGTDSQASGARTLRDYVFLQTFADLARLGDDIVCTPYLGIREGRPN